MDQHLFQGSVGMKGCVASPAKNCHSWGLLRHQYSLLHPSCMANMQEDILGLMISILLSSPLVGIPLVELVSWVQIPTQEGCTKLQSGQIPSVPTFMPLTGSQDSHASTSNLYTQNLWGEKEKKDYKKFISQNRCCTYQWLLWKVISYRKTSPWQNKRFWGMDKH